MQFVKFRQYLVRPMCHWHENGLWCQSDSYCR